MTRHVLVYFSAFEKYSIPEDLIPLSGFALPGLASFPQAPHLCEDDLDMFEPLPDLSPVKMSQFSGIVIEVHLLIGNENHQTFKSDLYNKTVGDL